MAGPRISLGMNPDGEYTFTLTYLHLGSPIDLTGYSVLLEFSSSRYSGFVSDAGVNIVVTPAAGFVAFTIPAAVVTSLMSSNVRYCRIRYTDNILFYRVIVEGDVSYDG